MRRYLSTLVVLLALLTCFIAAWPFSTRGDSPPPAPDVAARFKAPARLARLPLEVRSTLTGQESHLGMFTPSAAPASLGLWRKELIPAPWPDFIPALVLDRAGHPHVVSCDGARIIYYAHHDGVAWRVEYLHDAGSVDRYLSLALDAAGRPHIAYHGYWGGLGYAYYDGATWRIEQVEGGTGDMGVYASIALDAADRPHIAYGGCAASCGMRYAVRETGGWRTQAVDTGTWAALQTSMALDVQGRPHISYFLDAPLKYATWDGVRWLTEAVDGLSAWSFSALRLDSRGQPHVAYVPYDGAVRHAYRTIAGWQIETIDQTYGISGIAGLALDAADNPHVVYGSWTSNILTYARRTAGAPWQHEAVATSTEFGLALDPAGRPAVAYRTNDGLVYATRDSDLADWSRLVYATYRDKDGNWDIYAARGNGVDPIRLTTDPALDTTPRFDRGARRVTFISKRDGSTKVYAMNADGSSQTRLTNNPGAEAMPAWSPDGTRIAFSSDRDGNAEIYVMNADGSGQTRLTNHPAWDGHPAWSPDGQRLVFVSERSGAPELWTMSADGSNKRQLTYLGGIAVFPAWSPSGLYIAFSDDANGDGWLDLAVMRADAQGLEHPLGPAPVQTDHRAPAWAPSDDRLAVNTVQWIQYGGNWYWTAATIIGVNLSGHLVYPLSTGDTDWWPSWSALDVTPPTCRVAALPVWSAAAYLATWDGTDVGGAGLQAFNVQMQEEGGAWIDWVTGTGGTSATATGVSGRGYAFRCRARDFASNTGVYPAWADSMTRVDGDAPQSTAAAPAYAPAGYFRVIWNGDDGGGSGVIAYDVQMRDDSSAAWTAWQTSVTATSAIFDGEPGHTYYFRVRAHDAVGNVETYAEGDGDAVTQVARYSLTGRVRDHRGEPVYLADVTAEPAALTIAQTGPRGRFALYFDEVADSVQITATRFGFGVTPPMANVAMTTTTTPFFILPPVDERVADGGFEIGDLAAWRPSGDPRPRLSDHAHTGRFAAQLGASQPAPGAGPLQSSLEQDIVLPPVSTQPVLSLLYQSNGAAAGDALIVALLGADPPVTYTLPIALTGWQHWWQELIVSGAPTVTLRIAWTQANADHVASVLVEEISLGPLARGVYRAWLPMLKQQ